MKAVLDLYERITDKTLLIRRVYITANQLTDEKLAAAEPVYQQMNLFTDYLKSEVSEASYAFRKKEIRKKCYTERQQLTGRFHNHRAEQPDRRSQSINGKETKRQIPGHHKPASPCFKNTPTDAPL